MPHALKYQQDSPPSDSIVDSFILYIDDMSKLSPKKLFEIVNSIDLSLNATIQSLHCNSQHDAVMRIKSCCHKTKQISESRLWELFSTDFKDMSHVAAISVARSHGIETSYRPLWLMKRQLYQRLSLCCFSLLDVLFLMWWNCKRMPILTLILSGT